MRPIGTYVGEVILSKCTYVGGVILTKCTYLGGFSIRNRQKEPKNAKKLPAAQKIGQQLVHEWVEE